MRWGLRRPPAQQRDAAELDRAAELQPEAEAAAPTVHWSGGSALASKAASGLLWMLLAAGPVGLAVAAYALISAAPPVQAVATRPDMSGERTAAGEFGEQVVTAWLTTTRGNESRTSGLLPDGYTAPRLPFKVRDLEVAAAEQAPDGVWSVVVGATVTDAGKRTSRQYFQVPVQVTPTGMAALTVPAVVAAPATTAPEPLRYRQPLGLDGAVGTTVQQFLAAMTTGVGDVTRYVSPGTTVRPVDPAPFRALKLLRLDAASTDLDDTATPADGATARLLAAAVGENASGQELPLSYSLTVRARAGRWEVAAVDPSPVPDSASSPRPPEAGASTPASGTSASPTNDTGASSTALPATSAASPDAPVPTPSNR